VTLQAWLLAAAGMVALTAVCGLVASRRRTFEALVALQLAGTLTAVALVCLTVGLQASSYANVPLIAAVLNFVGTLICVRFLDRSRV
jgi:multisubunit Na+/H+ antiporter MnhF subunit